MTKRQKQYNDYESSALFSHIAFDNYFTEKTIDVRYKGKVVGSMTSDKTLVLNDVPEAEEILEKINNNKFSISSRSIGKIDANGKIIQEELNEYNLLDNED